MGPPEQTKIYLFAMGRSGGTSCFNDDKSVIGLRNLVTERGVISLCDHVTERDVTERDVTERDVIGQYDLIVERDRHR